jgi:nicotinamide-nucleotide amidase
MNVEVINTGTELLFGSVINTHLAYFAQALFPLGLRVNRQITVPDGDAIQEALTQVLPRADVVLVTGGLGPTTDDLTREITAELLGRDLRYDPEIMETIAARFASRGITMTERVVRQAHVPEGAVVLPNNNGTAPGLYIDCPPSNLTGGHHTHLFLLPGPPRELKPMFEESVLPILDRLVPKSELHSFRIYQVLGMGESNVEDLIGEKLLAIPNLELGYCARPGEVDVRCIGPEEALQAAEKIIMEALGKHVISKDGRGLEEMIVESLTARGETLTTAESCTGGALANRVTNVSGASAVFLSGYVTYSNDAKSMDLGIDPLLIESYGAVSREVAAAMAEGALRRSGATWALSTTGIAGPTGGTPEKPVGTVFIGLAQHGGLTLVEPHRFNRDRESFKQLVTRTALDMLRKHIANA